MGNQFEMTDLRKGVIHANCAPGWIYGFHFDDGGDGPQKLRVGEWVSGNLLRGKTPNPWEFYIYIFVAGGMNLNSWNFSLVFFWGGELVDDGDGGYSPLESCPGGAHTGAIWSWNFSKIPNHNRELPRSCLQVSKTAHLNTS